MTTSKGPAELWAEAGGDRDRYRALLEEHGHLVPVERCRECGGKFRHRHDRHQDGRVILVDVFGHDVR